VHAYVQQQILWATFATITGELKMNIIYFNQVP